MIIRSCILYLRALHVVSWFATTTQRRLQVSPWRGGIENRHSDMGQRPTDAGRKACDTAGIGLRSSFTHRNCASHSGTAASEISL